MQIRVSGVLCYVFRLAHKPAMFGLIFVTAFCFPYERERMKEYFFRNAQKSVLMIICGRTISSHCGSLRRTAEPF